MLVMLLTAGSLGLEPGGPAAETGLASGDVVASVGGKPVFDLHPFHDLLQRHRIGEPVDVTVWRDGQTLTLRPVPEEYR